MMRRVWGAALSSRRRLPATSLSGAYGPACEQRAADLGRGGAAAAGQPAYGLALGGVGRLAGADPLQPQVLPLERRRPGAMRRPAARAGRAARAVLSAECRVSTVGARSPDHASAECGVFSGSALLLRAE